MRVLVLMALFRVTLLKREDWISAVEGPRAPFRRGGRSGHRASLTPELCIQTPGTTQQTPPGIKRFRTRDADPGIPKLKFL